MYTQIVIKLFFFFFSSSIRMSRKNVNFGDKQIKRIDFFKRKKVTKINDVDVTKILVSKEEPYVQEIHSNTLLDITIMMLLHHSAYSFN